MLSFSGSLKVFVALEACDLRKGFNGLHGIITEKLREDPRGGALFVFTNRRRTRLKILCWDGTGLPASLCGLADDGLQPAHLRGGGTGWGWLRHAGVCVAAPTSRKSDPSRPPVRQTSARKFHCARTRRATAVAVPAG